MTSRLVCNTGNGGDAVICNDGKVLMLDFVEAAAPYRKIKITDPGSRAVLRDVVQGFFNQLKELRSPLADWEGFAMDLVQDIEVFQERGSLPYLGAVADMGDYDLPDVPDSKELLLPGACSEKRQLVIQNPVSVIPSEQERMKKFLIDARLLKRMSPFQVGMMVLHETVLAAALAYDKTSKAEPAHLDTRKVRFISEHIASDAMSTLTTCEWASLYQEASLGKPTKDLELDCQARPANATSLKMVPARFVSQGPRYNWTVSVRSRYQIEGRKFQPKEYQMDISRQLPWSFTAATGSTAYQLGLQRTSVLIPMVPHQNAQFPLTFIKREFRSLSGLTLTDEDGADYFKKGRGVVFLERKRYSMDQQYHCSREGFYLGNQVPRRKYFLETSDKIWDVTAEYHPEQNEIVIPDQK